MEFAESVSENVDISLYECTYKYNIPETTNYVKLSSDDQGPFGTEWIHDNQCDDIIDDDIIKKIAIYRKLRLIKSPPQRSDEWKLIRSNRITASDAGTVLGLK